MQNTSLRDSKLEQFTEDFKKLVSEAIDFGYCLAVLEQAEQKENNNGSIRRIQAGSGESGEETERASG